ncbi:hydrolase [Noviherbaspirillum aridicola]|uniref:Hydrolase n=2 Tax=Noviherbaspirillum aridicola TaxID=2849687 RepID=A0ABQ4Q960_9BURK|nr:hydrolase [Noviherbaspirillum aridicola]
MALSIRTERIRIPLEYMEIEGVLSLPEDALGVVMFADTGVGARVKPGNDYLGAALRGVRLGTLWLDLLRPEEAQAKAPRPPAALLHARLAAACGWLGRHPATESLPVALFGAGEAGAAALELASGRPACICAVVTRGASVDMVETGTLAKIAVPTLLIVGSLDDALLAASRGAYAALRCKKRLEIVPGATRDFEEPGSPEVVARLARAWFLQHARFAMA